MAPTLLITGWSSCRSASRTPSCTLRSSVKVSRRVHQRAPGTNAHLLRTWLHTWAASPTRSLDTGTAPRSSSLYVPCSVFLSDCLDNTDSAETFAVLSMTWTSSSCPQLDVQVRTVTVHGRRWLSTQVFHKPCWTWTSKVFFTSWCEIDELIRGVGGQMSVSISDKGKEHRWKKLQERLGSRGINLARGGTCESLE